MPQFQMIEPAPSFGGELGKALGGGLGAGLSQGISTRLNQMLEDKKNFAQGNALAAAIGKPELGALLGKLGPENSKFILENFGAENLADAMRRISGISDIDASQREPDTFGMQPSAQGVAPSQAQDIDAIIRKAPAKQQPALIKAKQAQETLDLRKSEVQEKREKEQKSKETAQKSINRAFELLKKGNLGVGSKIKSTILGGETAQDVGEFQSVLGAIEAELVDRVSRGTLSNDRFQYITQTLLPRPNDRQDVIEGKIKGLAQVLDLEPPGKELVVGEEFKSLPSASKNKNAVFSKNGKRYKSDGKSWKEI